MTGLCMGLARWPVWLELSEGQEGAWESSRKRWAERVERRSQRLGVLLRVTRSHWRGWAPERRHLDLGLKNHSSCSKENRLCRVTWYR